MKKILLFVLVFICLKSFGQYPVNQSLGSDSTLVTSKGAFKSRLINRPFSDTTQANTQRIKFYDGAQIWTTTDNKFWLRDSANNIWAQQGGSVTGANNGDTLIGGNIGLGGTLIRQTRISASNNAFLLDSLGTGSTFKAYPNSSASVFRYFKIVNGNTSDSAYLWIGGKTAATTRTVQLGVNASVDNSKVEFFANNISGSYVYGGINATSPNRLTVANVDTLKVYLAATNSVSASFSNLYIYPDSISFYQSAGEYYVYGLNRETDSAGLDLMAFDRSNSEWVRIPSDIVGGGGGAVNTIYSADDNLATNRIVGLNGKTLALADGSIFSSNGLFIDPTAGSEVASLQSHNPTGLGNDAFVAMETNTTSAATTMVAQFNGGGNISTLEVSANSALQGITGSGNFAGFNVDSFYINSTLAGSANGWIWTLINPVSGSGRWAANGATSTLQQVITAGATLTGNNTIAGGGFDFVLNDANSLYLNSTLDAAIRMSDGTAANTRIYQSFNGADNPYTSIEAVNAAGTNVSVITVQDDSITIRAEGGKLFIPDMQSSADTLTYKPFVISSTGVTKTLSYWPSGGGGSSDITIGTTTITSGTNTRPLYNNAGVVGEYTITGTGTVVAMQTDPTFVTSITAPFVKGGTGTTDDLILQSTSGVAAAGSVVQIKTGNNGALTAYSLNELGSATIGSTAAATSTVPLIVTGPTSHATYIQQWTKNASNYWAAITQSGAIRFTNDGTEITGNDYAELGYITGVGGPGFVNRSVDPDPVFLLGASATEALRMKSTYGLGWSSSTATAAASDAAIGRNGTRQLYIQGIGSSGTNAVARPFILNNPTSGTAVAGMGTGQEFQFENGSGTQSVMMQIDAVSTDVTAASEDADFVVTVKDAGALVEGFRINSDGKPIFRTTVTAGGTTGNQTIDKATGTVNFATGTSTLTVTNSLVTATSIVFAVIRTNDAAALIKNVVPGAGSFVITLNAATGAETSVGFLVINN